MPAKLNIPVGTRFGKLIFKGVSAHPGTRNRVLWTCLCDCGRVADVRADCVKTGKASCDKCPRPRTHGMIKSSEYDIWAHIKSRCLTPTTNAYSRYGGRGIKIFEGWIDDFMAFYNYVGARPSPKHTIERIDNNGHYEPGNVRWATMKEQARNTRSNRLLTLQGKTLCIAEWAEIVPIKQATIRARKANGWSDEKALTEPVDMRYSTK